MTSKSTCTPTKDLPMYIAGVHGLVWLNNSFHDDQPQHDSFVVFRNKKTKSGFEFYLKTGYSSEDMLKEIGIDSSTLSAHDRFLMAVPSRKGRIGLFAVHVTNETGMKELEVQVSNISECCDFDKEFPLKMVAYLEFGRGDLFERIYEIRRLSKESSEFHIIKSPYQKIHAEGRDIVMTNV